MDNKASRFWLCVRAKVSHLRASGVVYAAHAAVMMADQHFTPLLWAFASNV